MYTEKVLHRSLLVPLIFRMVYGFRDYTLARAVLFRSCTYQVMLRVQRIICGPFLPTAVLSSNMNDYMGIGKETLYTGMPVH